MVTFAALLLAAAAAPAASPPAPRQGVSVHAVATAEILRAERASPETGSNGVIRQVSKAAGGTTIEFN